MVSTVVAAFQTIIALFVVLEELPTVVICLCEGVGENFEPSTMREQKSHPKLHLKILQKLRCQMMEAFLVPHFVAGGPGQFPLICVDFRSFA